MKRARKTVQAILGLLAAFIFLVGSWTASYFILKALFRRFGAPSSDFVSQLLGVLLGFFILFCLGGLVSLFSRGRQRAFYIPIMNAIRRIAKGDFTAKVEDVERYGQFGELVEGINEMASELSRMETMRQDFISNVSHEIQSPLTSIRGFARALRSEDLSRETREHYLDIIETESARLSGLSDSLLKLSVLESGSFPFEAKPYRLDKQLRNILLACEPQWMGKEIEVEAELAEMTVTAVEDLLSQVWNNLLHNSIKFTPPGGKITITARLIATGAEIIVSDTGAGISKEDLPRIFERFYKADKARGAGAGGSGLGLSLVKKIVDLHRGEVRAESRPGEGTEIIVTLPPSVKEERE
ncbi:Signal transduction histidine kinase [Paenibacillus sophorae]|uniref:histidine kinase n=2 Tax=Paenibacillus sophorae TaxID=1333845 RepID=A0A1H8IDY6_9BACL|nr:HAMP domain-containing sensor histidine kinase [Paenibacillus sophorae]QWU18107.1 HAMP domain-containing histidine kinase [Paenibacillus sophorae]SEN66415.1 Signal transduction histidine kinase [Paenibacillus sophorae]